MRKSFERGSGAGSLSQEAETDSQREQLGQKFEVLNQYRVAIMHVTSQEEYEVGFIETEYVRDLSSGRKIFRLKHFEIRNQQLSIDHVRQILNWMGVDLQMVKKQVDKLRITSTRYIIDALVIDYGEDPKAWPAVEWPGGFSTELRIGLYPESFPLIPKPEHPQVNVTRGAEGAAHMTIGAGTSDLASPSRTSPQESLAAEQAKRIQELTLRSYELSETNRRLEAELTASQEKARRSDQKLHEIEGQLAQALQVKPGFLGNDAPLRKAMEALLQCVRTNQD